MKATAVLKERKYNLAMHLESCPHPLLKTYDQSNMLNHTSKHSYMELSNTIDIQIQIFFIVREKPNQTNGACDTVKPSNEHKDACKKPPNERRKLHIQMELKPGFW